MTCEQIKILDQLVSKYKEKQINVCIEEMSELTKALCKHNRGETDIENIKEEIADVHIMIAQMLLLFEIDGDEYSKIVDYKINRTKDRLLDNCTMGYRVENQNDKHGIWRDFEGNLNPIFNKLSEGKCREMPMEDSDFYRFNNEKWFSAAPTKETLKHWFSKLDVLQLSRLGYKIYEFELIGVRKVSDYELVFTRNNIISQREIDYKEIWED